MNEFLESFDDDSIDEEDRKYTISKTGIEEILGWIRFQSQMCEMIHDEMQACDQKEHEIAMLMAFVIHPWMEFYNIKDMGSEDQENNKE